MLRSGLACSSPAQSRAGPSPTEYSHAWAASLNPNKGNTTHLQLLQPLPHRLHIPPSELGGAALTSIDPIPDVRQGVLKNLVLLLTARQGAGPGVTIISRHALLIVHTLLPVHPPTSTAPRPCRKVSTTLRPPAWARTRGRPPLHSQESQTIARTASQHPKVREIIDHRGNAWCASSDLDSECRGLIALHRRRNSLLSLV